MFATEKPKETQWVIQKIANGYLIGEMYGQRHYQEKLDLAIYDLMHLITHGEPKEKA